MKQALQVIQSGILSQIQDLGRFGQAHLGMTTSGAADPFAHRIANRLLGNNDNAPVIEMSLGGAEFVALNRITIALCGADCPLYVNQQPISNWQSHHLLAGDRLSIGMATQGTRIYLAISQGFKVNKQFGSTSTTIREAIGGLDGQALFAKQILTVPTLSAAPLQQLAFQHRPTYPDALQLRVILGYQARQFPSVQIERFLHHRYQITNQSDRMGYRLSGVAIDSKQSQMYSEGICYGAIQVPPDGQPIILLNDRQTIGGYPKLGTVLSLDCTKLAQSRPGVEVSFCAISQEEAHNALLLHQQKLNNLSFVSLSN